MEDKDGQQVLPPIGFLELIKSIFRITLIYSIMGLVFLVLSVYFGGNIGTWIFGSMAIGVLCAWFSVCRKLIKRYTCSKTKGISPAKKTPFGFFSLIRSLMIVTLIAAFWGALSLGLTFYFEGNFWSWVFGFLTLVAVYGWVHEWRLLVRRYKWFRSGARLSDEDISRIINAAAQEISATLPYEITTNIPIGRAHAYLTNFMDSSIDAEKVYGFKPERSATQEELREYGFMLTGSGICVAKQYDTSKSDSENKKAKVLVLPFHGVYDVRRLDNELQLYFCDSTTARTIKSADVPVSLDTLECVYGRLLSTGASAALYRRQRSNDELDDVVGDYDHEAAWQDTFASGGRAAAAVTAMQGVANSQVQKYHVEGRGSVGHGWAAEDANALADTLKGQSAKVTGGNNFKNGPDRVVNGVEIQTKYCASANASVTAAFDNKTGMYKYTGQSSSRHQQLEVPYDQYDEAVSLMRKKIADGKVPGESNPDKATTIVRRGTFTLSTVKAIAKAGTFESVSFDLVTGTYLCLAPGGMTAALSFAFAVWNGANKKEAAKIGLYNGAKVVGFGALMYTITTQLSRESTRFGKNLVASSAKNLARSVRQSAMAKTSLGKSLGISNLSGKAIIGTGIVAVVTFGPDIARALVGRISLKQLMKNSAVGASGLGGAAIGQALIPIPLVGAAVGAMASALLAKALLDGIIEDDVVGMFYILKEEFIDQVMLISFSKEEFNDLLATVFQQANMGHFLRDMFQKKNDAREYAREFVNDAIAAVLKVRPVITDADYVSGINELTEEAA